MDAQPTKLRIEPLLWLLFSAGGVVAAFFIPIHLFILGIAAPLGLTKATDYASATAFLAFPIVRLYLFLLCSLGLGLLISAFSRTQTQAIQFSVFFLLPVFVLSGAFAPLEQLPKFIRYVSEIFPLTHFCRAFRNVNLHHSHISSIAGDLAFLAVGAIVTCAGASYLLRVLDD